MNVAGILKLKGHDVLTLGPSSTLKEAADALTHHKIGAVVVADDDEALGILSERDIVRAVSLGGSTAMTAPISRYMTEKVVTCGYEDTVDQLMEAMTSGRFRHVPVVEGGRLKGIISIGDVVKHRIAETEQEAEAMRVYIANG